jgi:hypothetical protein
MCRALVRLDARTDAFAYSGGRSVLLGAGHLRHQLGQLRVDTISGRPVGQVTELGIAAETMREGLPWPEVLAQVQRRVEFTGPYARRDAA